MTFLKDRRFVLGAGLGVLLILLFVFTHQGRREPEAIQVLSAGKGTTTPNSFDITSKSIPLQEGSSYYIDAVDGSDTLTLRTGGSGTLFRLLGVQSPVRAGFGNCYDRDAADNILRLLSSGPVVVRFDQSGVTADAAGNPAGYLFLADGTMLNASILENGYGKFFPGTSVEFASNLETAEQNARLGGRGIWKGKCKTNVAVTPSTTLYTDPWSMSAPLKTGTTGSGGTTSTTGGTNTTGASTPPQSTTGTGSTGSDGLDALPPPPPPPPPPM